MLPSINAPALTTYLEPEIARPPALAKDVHTPLPGFGVIPLRFCQRKPLHLAKGGSGPGPRKFVWRRVSTFKLLPNSAVHFPLAPRICGLLTSMS